MVLELLGSNNGSLLNRKLQVQHHRVVSSMGRVHAVARVTHCFWDTGCGEYHNPCPNAVWHLDGHHKLGPWGIMIHGISDGYDHLVGISFHIFFVVIE